MTDPDAPRGRPEVDSDTLQRALIGPTPSQLRRLDAGGDEEGIDWGVVSAGLEEFGNRRGQQILYLLSRARVHRNLTQAAVGQRLGRAQSSIARMERGSTDPKLSTIAAYAAALDLRIEIVDSDGVALRPGDERLNARGSPA